MQASQCTVTLKKVPTTFRTMLTSSLSGSMFGSRQKKEAKHNSLYGILPSNLRLLDVRWQGVATHVATPLDFPLENEGN